MHRSALMILLAAIAGLLAWDAGVFSAKSPGMTPDPAARAQARTPEPTTRPAPVPTWQPIAQWTGNGSKDTPSFITSTREWRIRWLADVDIQRDGSQLAIVAHRADTGLAVGSVSTTRGRGDVATVHADPGAHYLSVISWNTDWSITVEEFR